MKSGIGIKLSKLTIIIPDPGKYSWAVLILVFILNLELKFLFHSLKWLKNLLLVTMNISSISFISSIFSIMCSIIGLSAILSNGFGWFSVKGYNLVAYPAASIMHFIVGWNWLLFIFLWYFLVFFMSFWAYRRKFK